MMKYPGSMHNHTDYSNAALGFRDSTNTIKSLIDYAIELGHSAIAITEHEFIGNHIKVEEYAEEVKDKIKVIRGNEIYLCRNGLNLENRQDKEKYYHFILLAKDAVGHEQLRELSTRAWSRSFMDRGLRRKPTYYSDLEEIISSNQGHVIGSTACFLKGARVKTFNGDKEIQNIKTGDIILTHTGEWQAVKYPTSREYKGTGYQLHFNKGWCDDSFVCTEDHKIFIYNRVNKNFIWKKANELTTKDCAVYPLETTKYSSNNILNVQDSVLLSQYRKVSIGQNYQKTIFRLPEQIVITDELARLFGLWLGDGSVSTKDAQLQRISFSFSDKEFQTYYDSFVKQGLLDLGLKESDININFRPENHKVEITCAKREVVLLFQDLFGENHAKTKFIPKRILHISKELDANIWFGYMLADGYFRQHGRSGECIASSVSRKLINDMYNLSRSLNIFGGCTIIPEKIDKNGVFHQQSYYLNIPSKILGNINKLQAYSTKEILYILQQVENEKRPQDKNTIQLNNVTYQIRKIKSITKQQIRDTVYCLNVDNHSFVCENVIVHNCMGSAIGTQLLEYKKTNDPALYQQIINWCNYLRDIFGKDNFYLEMQPSATKEQEYVNKELYKISLGLNIPYIITCDAHYLKKSEASIHEAYLHSQSDAEREVKEFYSTTYLMSTQELESYMDSYFTEKEFQIAYKNIQKIVDSCEDYSLLKPLRIPELPWKIPKLQKIDNKWLEKIPNLSYFINSSFEGDNILARALIERIEKDKTLQNEATYNEVNVELESTWISSEVNKAHWSSYFLNLQKIIDTCWDAGSIVGPGRGSGVGFLLLYILDITQINPLRETTRTYHWRFLNPARVSVLDVDFDISGLKRKQVLNKFREVYGEDRVANVITFGTEKSKSALLTAARGLEIDNDIAQYLASLIPSDRGMIRTLHQCYYGDKENDFKPISTFITEINNYPELWEVAQKIEGLICRTGIHAGGVVFVDEPFTKSTALMKAPDGTIITQFELHDLEKASQF